MFQKDGALISPLNRERLREPFDNLVYFVIYCFFIFEVTQVDKVLPSLCKRGLIDIFINCNSKFQLLFRSVKKVWCTFSPTPLTTQIYIYNLI